MSLLSHVQTKVIVDVDSMDPAVAQRHSDTCTFMDMTSNQAIVFGELSRPERAHVLSEAVASIKSQDSDGAQIVDNIIDLSTVLLAMSVYPYLKGSVHAQTSPAFAYDTEGTIRHAKQLVSLFEANGIPKTRVCIKIPATAPSIIACQYLDKIGIRTLATCLFSLPQALAASQAGCKYVAPYLNELRVHFEPSLWKEYDDTVKENPMCPVIESIVQEFKRIGSKTLVMPASIVTSAEVTALASLGIDHLTLSGSVLDQLAAAHPAAKEPKPHHPDVELAAPPEEAPHSKGTTQTYKDVDFLAEGAESLKLAIEADPEVNRKLTDALEIFGEMETKTKDIIRGQL